MAQGDVLEVVTNTNDGFTSITATLAVETPSAGDLLVSAYFTGAAVANLASGFTEALELTDAGNNDEGRLSFKRCASGSDNTVTESCGSSDENGVILMLIEGPFESAPLDVTAETAAGVGDDTVSTNTTGTTAQADEVAIAMWNDRRGSGGPSNNWASYTNSFVEQSDLKMANKGLAVATKLLTATGTVECTATNATYTLTSMAGIATFKLTVGSAVTGTIAATFPNLEASATATQTITGTVASTFPSLAAAATAAQSYTGTVAATFPSVTSAATAEQTITGTIAATLPSLTGSATGHMDASGAIAATFPSLEAAATATQTITGTVAATFPSLTASAAGDVSAGATGTVAATFPSLEAAATSTTFVATLSGTATASITEADIVAGGKTAIITLAGGAAWVPTLKTIGYVGGQTGGFAGTTSAQTINFALTGGLASVPAAGDLVIIAYAVGSTADRPLAIRNASAVDYDLMGTELYSNDDYDTNLRAAYRFMPGTPETSFVLTTSSGSAGTGNVADAGAYTVHVFRNVDTATPMDVAVVTDSAIDGHAANPPSITPTTSGAVTYAVGAGAMGTGAVFTSSDLTDFRSTRQNDNNDATIGAGYSTSVTDPAAFGGGGAGTTTDSWAALTAALRPAAHFADIRADIRTGMDSAQAEAAGWDARLTTIVPVGNIVRTSDTVVTITLAADAGYDVTAQETITVTVPSIALAAGGPLIASPTFTVDTAATTITGTIAATLPGLETAATGAMQPSGTIAATLPSLEASATGALAVSGTIAATFPSSTASATGYMQPSGTVAATFPSVSAAASGTVGDVFTGTVAATFPSLEAAATGTQTITGTVAATFGAPTAAATGVMQPSGTVAATFPSLEASATGTQTITGTVAATFPSLGASATGSGAESIEGTVSATFPSLEASATGAMQPSGTVAATFPSLEAVAEGSTTFAVTGTVAATFPSLEASASGTFGQVQPGATPQLSIASGVDLFQAPIRYRVQPDGIPTHIVSIEAVATLSLGLAAEHSYVLEIEADYALRLSLSVEHEVQRVHVLTCAHPLLLEMEADTIYAGLRMDDPLGALALVASL